MSESNNIKVLQGSKELRDRMPKGSIGLLANKYGYSWIWIHRIVTGKAKGNPAIIEDAERLAGIEDEMKQRIKTAI